VRQPLTPDTLKYFTTDFGTFHDAEIHKLDFVFYSIWKMGAKLILGIFTTQQETGIREWVNLTIDIEDVTKVQLVKERNYGLSRICRMNIAQYGKEFYFDLHPKTDNPERRADFESGITRDRKRLLLIGTSCYWEITEYQEHDQNPSG
jgi:hypothetical protein